MIFTLIVLSIVWFAFGFYSLGFYIRDFVIPQVKEEKFDSQMIVAMINTLLLPPLYWFIRSIAKSGI